MRTGAVICLLFASGCGEFFAQKPTELQSKKIRRDVKTVQPVPEPNLVIPEIYQMPPKIVEQVVGGAAEWKLFYFCKHHTSDQLAKMADEQFAHKLFNEEGKSTTVADYAVTSNPATNQLIARCPTKDDVKAVLEFLEIVDVPPIQVRIDCLISEVYADKTLDWETTVEIGDLLGEDITAGGSGRLYGQDVLDLLQEEPPLPAFPGASLRDLRRAKMGLKVGYSSLDHDFLAVVDLLESKGYLKILMNPSLEVVNGQKARIQSSETVPLDKTFIYDREGFVETKTEYIDVVDALEVVPHVFADGYIGLETSALIGSKSIPEGVTQIRVVSKREIYNKENRIRQGQSLVIGGIRKSEEHSVIRGVPFMKDIPLVGILFSSKDFEERAIETTFILTPTISSGGIPNRRMVEEIRKKHAAPDYPADLQDIMLDPLGMESRSSDQTSAEAAVLRAQQEAEQARADSERAKKETERAKAEAQQLRAILARLNHNRSEPNDIPTQAESKAEPTAGSDHAE